MAYDTRTVAAGPFRTEDGSPVDVKDARDGWVAAARPVLIALAKQYHGTVSYKDLAMKLQEASGITTRMALTPWIGSVLNATAHENHERDEPLLSALVVKPDGTASPGYAVSVAETYRTKIVTDAEVERHAAEERFKCYCHFGAALPADGGGPALMQRVATKRVRAKRAAAPYVSPRSCPTCSMVLPTSGRCVNCRRGV